MIQRFIFATAAILCAAQFAIGAEDPLAGYRNYQAFRADVEKLAESRLVSARVLAETLGGRDVVLLTVGRGNVDEKPAVLIVGGVEPAHLAGGELAMRVARKLATEQEHRKLLGRLTFYVIPRPSPDATEKAFTRPLRHPLGNLRNTDDDRDFDSGEDPAEDLNGDGVITMMRLEDEAGPWMPHPDDPRVLIEADPKKNERGRWRLLSEGLDNDEDEEFNEDGAGGVNFNRNFTFDYSYFKPHAGPHQVSEIETRAVADFCFRRPNIAVVFTFTPEDNLMHPWKPAKNQGKIRTGLQAPDAPYQNFLAAKYRKIHGGKNAPKSPAGAGSFSDWAYLHYGRWSLAARGWWVPQVESEKKDGEKPSGETRGAADLNALRWFEKNEIEGFVPWKRIKHPQFPDQRVEVGGFKPLYRMNPPVKLLAPLTEKHVKFLGELADLSPEIELADVDVEALGGRVFQVEAKIANRGYLPTLSEMGRISRRAHPLQIEISAGEEISFIKGSPRSTLSPIAGGDAASHAWIFRLPAAKTAKVKVRVWAPAVGEDQTIVKLK